MHVIFCSLVIGVFWWRSNFIFSLPKKPTPNYPKKKKEKPTPDFLQEDALEGYKCEANSFPTKELAFELTSPFSKVEEVILTSDGDDRGALATMDEGPKRRSRTSSESSWTLKTEQLLGGTPRKKIRIFIHLVF